MNINLPIVFSFLAGISAALSICTWIFKNSLIVLKAELNGTFLTKETFDLKMVPVEERIKRVECSPYITEDKFDNLTKQFETMQKGLERMNEKLEKLNIDGLILASETLKKIVGEYKSIEKTVFKNFIIEENGEFVPIKMEKNS